MWQKAAKTVWPPSAIRASAHRRYLYPIFSNHFSCPLSPQHPVLQPSEVSWLLGVAGMRQLTPFHAHFTAYNPKYTTRSCPIKSFESLPKEKRKYSYNRELLPLLLCKFCSENSSEFTRSEQVSLRSLALAEEQTCWWYMSEKFSTHSTIRWILTANSSAEISLS